MHFKKTLKKYIYERDNKKCLFCDKELLFHQISLDHYYPKSKKGSDDVFNIVLSCKKCNKYKESKVPFNYETVLLQNFIQGILDKKIKTSIKKTKYEELKLISENMKKIESIDKCTIFQGDEYRIYVKNNNVFKMIKLGKRKDK